MTDDDIVTWDDLGEDTPPPAPIVYGPFDARPYVTRATTRTLAVFDSETDPFAMGREIIEPFTCGFKNLETGDYLDFWGADCFDQFLDWLRAETAAGHRYLIYCHNFGGFDAHLGLLDHIDPGSSPSIINGRIVACSIEGQEFRDSYRLFPEALAGYAKDEFDYDKMERHCRDQYREQILLYQRHDCDYLGDLILEFFAMFGERPTIGNTAIDYLRSFHGFEKMTGYQDEMIRPFFMGGRTQAFLPGVHKGAWQVFDVNNMYGYCMREFRHPISAEPVISQKLWPITAFVEWEGENSGCMGIRAEDGSLDFRETRGRFFSTRHEIELGQSTGTIKIHRIIKSIGFREWGDFAAFIDFCKENRDAAKAAGDKIRDKFWKRLANSSYGKFAQDPRKYERFVYSRASEGVPDYVEGPYAFTPRFVAGDRIVWGRPAPNRFTGFFNVACGASITGAARAQLFRGLLAAKRAAYCDTDSVVCEGFRGNPIDIDPGRIGAWKLEATGDLWACAGKKLYALFTSDSGEALDDRGRPRERITFEGVEYWCVKKASKGAVLTAWEILKVAQGGRVCYQSDRPNFKLDGTVEFVRRWIERTD